jgi:uncharacterized protein YyaL (SSP411 family)
VSDDGEGRRPNRLIQETSPYLRQHAYNPVDWYPWGPEALDRAKTDDKPVLLSIGYAACHWCHVMERESFEDPEIAALMNENFVCIKVDREERPDIDSIYMDAVQAMTGQGGWPMTMFLTPEGRPFYGGTYFPPRDSHGLPSFRRLLESVSEAWRERRRELEDQGTKLVEHIASLSAPEPSPEPLTTGLITKAASSITTPYDEVHGGFGGPPKFPQAPVLGFLLRRPDPDVRRMLFHTLDEMARGGIYDHLGGGFHRYSVDEAWLVPHFEKMLYDNAQLARLYANAWQATKEPLYQRVAGETLEYLIRDMRHEAGGFYSSEDADSEGVEGKFYVWSHDEFMEIAPEAADYYRVSPEGNFEGSTILTAPSDEPPAEARARLMEARAKRIRPGLDDKILTSWNGLAIAAFAEAGAAFKRSDFVEAAREAAGFILQELQQKGRLLHSYKDGKARVLGMLEDYAYLTDGLLSLWEATFESQWLDECARLCREMLELFSDESGAGLFSTGRDHEQLIVRQKEVVESATPSPMAVAALTLQRLGALTGNQDYATEGGNILRLAHHYMERAPRAVPSYLSALDFWLSTPKEIVISARDAPASTELFDTVWQTYLPNRVVAASPPGLDSPLMEGKSPIDGRPTAYVCERYVCKAPTTDADELMAQLQA